MTRALFLTVGDAYWIDLTDQLKHEAALEVVYWSGHRPDRARLKALFPDCIVHETAEDMLMQGPAHRRRWPAFPLDCDTANKLAGAERIALLMMDRMDPTGRTMPFGTRRRHFRRLVGYWGGVLRTLQPDLVVFQISPHMVFDYVAYELAKLLGIPTLMFDRAGLPGHVLALERFEEGPPGLAAAYAAARKAGAMPSDAGLAFIERSGGRSGASLPPLFEAKMSRLGLMRGRAQTQTRPSLWTVLRRELRQLRHYHRRNGFGRQDVYFVQPGAVPETARVSFLRLAVLRWSGVLKQNRLHRVLSRYLGDFDPQSAPPYIFMALHYQPERATLPLGGIFADQVAMAETIAATLPKGWHLVVKEHPFQLSPFSRGYLQRDENFYRDLANLANVVLVAPDAPTDPLIANAKAVATITGSVGWQALCRGLPVLVFGAAWYRGCDGARTIRSVGDLRAALSEIEAGDRVASDDVRAFLSAIETISVRAVLEPKGEARPDIDRKANARALAEAVKPYLRAAGESAVTSKEMEAS